MPYRSNPIPALKRQLGAELARIIHRYQAWDIAPTMGTDGPRVSDLRKGKLDRFSLEALMRYTCRLGYRVELRFEKIPFGPRGRSETFSVRSD